MAWPKGKPRNSTNTVKADTSILTADERLEIEKEVDAAIEAELRAKAKEQLKADLRADKERAKGMTERQVDVHVDLAPYCDRILLDNVAYLQGMTYTVPASKAAVMNDVIQQTWKHQSEIDGKSENFYRRARTPRVTPQNMNAAASQILKA